MRKSVHLFKIKPFLCQLNFVQRYLESFCHKAVSWDSTEFKGNHLYKYFETKHNMFKTFDFTAFYLLMFSTKLPETWQLLVKNYLK